MSYIIGIVLVIVCCGGCFMMYGECCNCDICESETPTKEDSELQIPTTTSPIQEGHIEI